MHVMGERVPIEQTECKVGTISMGSERDLRDGPEVINPVEMRIVAGEIVSSKQEVHRVWMP